MDGYDERTRRELGGGGKGYDRPTVEALVAWESAQQQRAAYLTMLTKRLDVVARA